MTSAVAQAPVPSRRRLPRPTLFVAVGVALAISTETGAPHRALAGLLMTIVLLDGVASLLAGAEVACALAVAAVAWLLWALRRARSRHLARPMAPPAPVAQR